MAALPSPQHVHLNPHEPDDAYPMYGLGPVPKKKPGAVRIWVDGCFDMLHFGHTNALRQARNLGTELFVGCHSDEEVQRVKGPPTMTAKERYDALRACKWVDYVVENYPYSTRLKDMELLEIDFVAHGDDISTDANGQNSYQEIIDAGKFKVFKRTDGISTTDLVSRMLHCTSDHQIRGVPMEASGEEDERARKRYLTTNRKIMQFSNSKSPKSDDRIVYVDGSFDLFHVGHMRLLEEARKHGTYLIVGVHEDAVVNRVKGRNYPIMNLNERVLGVLSCRHVDEVVMGVPFAVTEDVIHSLNVDVVVGGKRNEAHDKEDPWKLPKEKGIFVEVDSGCELTTDGVIRRVLEQREAFMLRQQKKAAKDAQVEEDKPAEYRNVREVN